VNQRVQIVVAVVALVGIAIIAFVLGRGCNGPAPHPAPPDGIDAGPGETIIAAQLDASVQAGQAHIEQIEAKFDDDMAAFDAQQRAEYEHVRAGSLEDAAQYLSDWSRHRRVDAGSGS
jgi:hypothetical protein